MFADGATGKFLALPLAYSAPTNSNPNITERYGIPFVEGTLPLSDGGTVQIDAGSNLISRIYLLGMTHSGQTHCWQDPLDYSWRYFIGDELGSIHLNYADGSSQVYPLILGESVWWGTIFYNYSAPFSTSSQLRDALKESLHLYPPAPVQDGKYVAVIVPRPVPIVSISVQDVLEKKGVPVITGITLDTSSTGEVAGAITLPNGAVTPEMEAFASTKALLPAGVDEEQTERRLDYLRVALYSSDVTFKGPVSAMMPPGYSGPTVSYQGNMIADVLQNVFHVNVQDIVDKFGPDGRYHTSTKGALSWHGNGFGTYKDGVGMYYNSSWTRDMGRSVQELIVLGYTNEALRCADYSLKVARQWEAPNAPKLRGHSLPRHWARTDRADANIAFENDGHGLTSMFLYRLWQRLPNRDEWLRARWPDVQAAGDWILWQFDHPDISGATNGILHTTGESAGGNGYSVFADDVCRNALLSLAQMADSIGQDQAAARWRERAALMQKAIAANYIIDDPKYGKVWTLEHAGWPCKGTVLGPLIFGADCNGFAPEDDNADWRPVNEAAYQRLIDTYKPFGFYGQAMGYGQGFVTESALLLDRMHDATTMLGWIARQIYDPRFGCFITPEGCQVDPTGKYWYRAGDLGNGVQEAEIIKTMCIMMGVDDTHPNRLRFFPRMPYGWTEMGVEKYPVLYGQPGKATTTHLHYHLERTGNGMSLNIAAEAELGPVAMRLGPFEQRPDVAGIVVNGKVQNITPEHSGDSWWARFTAPIGTAGK